MNREQRLDVRGDGRAAHRDADRARVGDRARRHRQAERDHLGRGEGAGEVDAHARGEHARGQAAVSGQPFPRRRRRARGPARPRQSPARPPRRPRPSSQRQRRHVRARGVPSPTATEARTLGERREHERVPSCQLHGRRRLRRAATHATANASTRPAPSGLDASTARAAPPAGLVRSALPHDRRSRPHPPRRRAPSPRPPRSRPLRPRPSPRRRPRRSRPPTPPTSGVAPLAPAAPPSGPVETGGGTIMPSPSSADAHGAVRRDAVATNDLVGRVKRTVTSTVARAPSPAGAARCRRTRSTAAAPACCRARSPRTRGAVSSPRRRCGSRRPPPGGSPRARPAPDVDPVLRGQLGVHGRPLKRLRTGSIVL